MMTPRPFAPGTFTWALGIEDTCVYPPDDHPSLDEHLLTDHVLHREQDLRTVASLGATAVRYGMSWPLANPALDIYDWSSIDPAIELADELGITLVADLVHYGTPPWLADAFADPRYPDAIARFSQALASRYRGRLTCFTPLNEPVTTASFCGLRGVWPPYRSGWEGWVSVIVPIAVGMSRTIDAIRRVQPEAVIVHVEAATDIHATEQALGEQAQLIRDLGWLPTDLLLGRVDVDHPLHSWLLAHGAQRAHLDELAGARNAVDVVGVNYYPDLTPRRLMAADKGVVQVSFDRGARGLRDALTGFANRYGLPLMVTETSIEGADESRAAWLRDSTREVASLRAGGYDIRGYTWWPLLDFVDWSFASGGANVEEFAITTAREDGGVDVAPAPPLGDPADGRTPFLRRMGLLRLEEQPDGSLARRSTATACSFAGLTAATDLGSPEGLHAR